MPGENFFRAQSGFAEDVAGTHDGVLRVGAGFTFKAQGIFYIKCDYRALGEFEHEVTKRTDRDLRGDAAPLRFRHLRVACIYFFLGGSDQRIEQVVGFYAEAFASGDFYIAPLLVFL